MGTFFLASCKENYTPGQIAEDYCYCAQLHKTKKRSCVREWLVKYKSTLKTKEDYKEVNYSMIECNGFEGDNDFNLKLMKN